MQLKTIPINIDKMKKINICRTISVCLGLVSFGGATLAANIVCDLEVSNSSQRLVIRPTSDIYAVEKIDLPGGFRFSGQYLPVAGKFKTYTYTYSKNRYVLLTSQEFNATEFCQSDFGQNRVYAGAYERELFFQCKQICAD
jgi:hypothetical protein